MLKYGFRGIQERAMERAKSASDQKQKGFLEGVRITCEAMKKFSTRFAELALKLAKEEKNPARKEELFEISDICFKVPWNPPETFHEALQAMWFVQNAAIISYGAGSGITPGRVDQLLYPYYKNNIEQGIIDQDYALRLVEEFIIKLNNNVVIWPNIAGVKLNPLGSDIENITLGGVDREGNDATNELSFLFIEALRNTKLATSASFRISKNSSEEFLQRIIRLNRETSSPAFFNDEITVPMMVNDGYSEADARDYCIVGCVEPSDNAKTFGATGGSKVYFPTALDLVFNRGKTTFFGNQDGPDTGDPAEFESFEEFMEAYFAQLNHIVESVAQATNLRDKIWATHYHNPLISCT
ncbi:MAG TPA: pyruvate formate lyase family protein, partial [Candidatus Lokiarchaeia archaeon]|nr:pyruvate formate lyase family protein [Candidatus Lokiarchaeia archaeon]